MKIKNVLTILMIFVLFSSVLYCRLTLQNIYIKKGKVTKLKNTSNRPYYSSEIIPTSFFSRVYFLIDSVDASVKKNSDLVNQLVLVTVFKSTDFKFLRDQLKHVDDLISDLSKCKKQLKSYLVSFNKKGNTNKNRIIKLEKMEAKNRKILKKARKVIADLSLSKVTEDYYMDRKTQESSKLNDAWVFGKISADEYAELRKKLDDPKKRAEYVRKDLEKQREIISENESVMNRSMIERKKIPQLEDQWNNVKLWTKKYINKINDKMLEMKTIRHELKQKVDSDIH